MQTLAEPYLNSPPPAEAPICATLALINIKSGRYVKVIGASGKGYEFCMRSSDRLMVREYRSPEVFAREEMDMRKCVKSRYVITTLLGTVHPVIHAQEALAALINARAAVQIPARKAALRHIAETAYAAILTLELPPQEEVDPPDTPEESSPSPESAVALAESRWTGEDGQQMAPPAAAEPGIAHPISTGGLLTHAELMQGEWKSVKLIARSFNIVIAQKNKMQLADEILAKQASGVRPQEALAKEGA